MHWSRLRLCGAQTELTPQKSGDHYVLAKARVATYFADESSYEIVQELKGSDLVGAHYQPLFPYFADQANAFQILSDGYVGADDGTGIVHIAPAYGEDDYRVGRAAGIELVDPLDENAVFTDAVSDFAGQFCKDADKDIIRWLKDAGKLFHQSTIHHSYPFCERTDTPLIYRAIEAWYVKVEDLRDDLVANNEAINWVPDYVGEKRFGNWLKDAKDWNISRNRFWGSCIPVWVNEADSSDMICIGSIDQLEELSGVRVSDLHKDVVDQVVIHRDGKTYRRTPEVLDCWFESGSMPYAQQHYPFSAGAAGGDTPGDDRRERRFLFPAHFIAEGLDQTRGWFYTLLILGTCLFGKSPYRSVVVNGLILAEDGSKMSKRKKNYPDPNVVMDQYGADALRAYLINSPVVRGEPLRFSEPGLKDIVRTVVLPYWNALSFLTTYAEVDGYDPRSWTAAPVAERSETDRWILSVLQSLVGAVNEEMEGYRLYRVIPRLVTFIDDLTNWYLRRSRRRFWKSEDDADKANAYATLYDVLVTFAKVLAPFMPFITEAVYQHLVRRIDETAPESIHWCDFPQVDRSLIDEDLETGMDIIRRSVGLGRKLREEQKIKVRQPLPCLTIVHRDAAVQQTVARHAELLQEELNVKTVASESDESQFVSVSIKPNFAVLRQRCPSKIGPIGKALKDWGAAEVAQLEAGESITVADEAIDLEAVLLQRQAAADTAVATDGEVSVVLDTTIDEALRLEGLAREMTSLVQNMRKTQGFEVSDRIVVQWFSTDDAISQAMAAHQTVIANEVLATSIQILDEAPADVPASNIEGYVVSVVITAAS